jgi:transposase
MSPQDTISEEISQEQGIIVPLELADLRILKQEVQADGTLRVEVIGSNERAKCLHCGAVCVKQHDVRKRCKRDVPLRGHPVELVLHKRRFWCFRCQKAFTESDSACGRRRRTTVRLREAVGKQASNRPLAHVAAEYQVGPRFVQTCLESVAQTELAKRGLSLDEQAKLPTPRYLGIDEFARRKGRRYDTILCDLEHRHVLEVCAGRKQADVTGLLERLSDCDAVEAGSQDMSETFRGAVQLCLPRARIVADHFHVVQHVGKAGNLVLGRIAQSVKQARRRKRASGISSYRARNSFLRSKSRRALPWLRPFPLWEWLGTSKKTCTRGMPRRPKRARPKNWMPGSRGSSGRDLLSCAKPCRPSATGATKSWPSSTDLATRLSNGFVEGKNNRTKALMRQGYGYRNRGHLRLRILLEVA